MLIAVYRLPLTVCQAVSQAVSKQHSQHLGSRAYLVCLASAMATVTNHATRMRSFCGYFCDAAAARLLLLLRLLLLMLMMICASVERAQCFMTTSSF